MAIWEEFRADTICAAIGFFALALIWMVSHLVVHNSAGDLCYKNPQIENADIPRLSSIGTLVCISLSTLLLCENLASFLYQADAISGLFNRMKPVLLVSPRTRRNQKNVIQKVKIYVTKITKPYFQ